MKIEFHTKSCQQAGEVMREMGDDMPKTASIPAMKFVFVLRANTMLQAKQLTREAFEQVLDAIGEWVPDASHVNAFFAAYLDAASAS